MKILLAEDNADHAELTIGVLQELLADSEITHLSNGEAVLAHAQAGTKLGRPPELLLLDIKMPRMNGYEVLKTLKSDPALVSLPVVVITTSADERDRQACLALGAADYLVKPLTSVALSACLARLGLAGQGPCGELS